MQQSPATFIYVIDLTNTDSEITKQLNYWLAILLIMPPTGPVLNHV